MAHFVRPLALAETLEPERYEIHFYAPSRYSRHLNNKPFTTGELASMPGEQFLANIAKGRAPVSGRHDSRLRGAGSRIDPKYPAGPGDG